MVVYREIFHNFNKKGKKTYNHTKSRKMYSGGDSSGDGANSHNQFNWQMLSQTSCNVNSGGAIDWASLAQQWIQMKDSGANLPEAPPAPIISSSMKNAIASVKFDEQGEADMEVEKEDEVSVVGFGADTQPGQTVNNFNSNRWFQQQPEMGAFLGAPQQNQWAPWPPRVTLPPPALHVPIIPEVINTPILKEAMASSTPPMQNIAKTPAGSVPMMPIKESTEAPPMDAAKRKVLPAWIREGLEKMEREKLKQLEREKRDKQSPPAPGTIPTETDLKDTFKTMVKNSTVEMEGESSGNEALNDTAEGVTFTTYEDIDGDAMVAPADSQQQQQQQHVSTDNYQQESIKSFSGKTYEERMSDMMIAVRKTLTELLLEVTNDEISSIAHEAIRKQRAKASSVQVIRKSAIPSITGKLGLEAYADSDSENSASDDEADHNDSKRFDDGNDSEEELKANIRICKRAFAKKIEEIEELVASSAAREEQLLKEHQQQDARSHGTTNNVSIKSPLHKTKGFDPEIGEPQPDKKLYSNGKRRKERTSRFSDSKDSRHRVNANYFPASSMGTSNLPPHMMPGASPGHPSMDILNSKYANKINANTSSTIASGIMAIVPPPLNEKQRSSNSGSSVIKASKSQSSHSSSRHQHQRHSDSSSSSTDSTSSDSRSSHSRRSKHSDTHRKRSSTERSKRSHRSSSYRSNRRAGSSDSNDDDHYKKRSSHRRHPKSSSSSLYSRRHDRRRSASKSSRSRTRTRSRSRSRSTTYSSSRRGDRY